MAETSIDSIKTQSDSCSTATDDSHSLDFCDLPDLITRFEGLKTIESPDFEKLYSTANVAHKIAQKTKNKAEEIKYLKEARLSALAAHEVKPDSFSALKILCSATGKLAEESSKANRIRLGFEFKDYLDKANAMCRDSYEMLHMRARFHYHVCTLSTAERLIGKTFGLIPECSLEQAIADFLQAERVESDCPENAYFLGKTYLAAGNREEARKWIQKAASADPNEYEADNAGMIEDARALLQSDTFRDGS
ncbi:hypothetical protein WR25_20491 [Diploscapter pachys]|uniref:Uncharacterized protein n=1 Tax=Diploscapter pachys TaxID=2018661 RepID=A0A2A2JS05_9BILA|nr:hypothetical protein WR25_20491 [Diploscapter pachys]